MPELDTTKMGEAGWRVRLRAGRQILGILWRADPRRAALTAALSPTSALATPLAALLQGRLINAVAAQQISAAVWAGVAIGLITLTASGLAMVAFRLRLRVREVGGHALRQHSAATVAGIPGVEHLERPDVADRVQLLQNAQVQLAGLLDTVILNAARVLSAGVTLVILASVSPLFLLLVAFGAPTVWVGHRTAKAGDDLGVALTPAARRMWLLRHALETPDAAGEVRVFGLADELTTRHQRLWADGERQRRHLDLRNQALTSGAWLLFALGYLGALAIVVSRALDGQASVGDVAIITALGVQIRTILTNFVDMATMLVDLLRTSERFAWVEKVASDAAEALSGDEVKAEPPVVLRHGIDLVDVTFRYPGTDTNVLQDVTVHLPAGATVAIVGDNGAGKSTLVKLLARFYEPTGGRIEVDGTPICHIPMEAWRGRLSAGFQDFSRLQLPARESVGVGDHPVLSREDADLAVLQALGRASADAVLADLPQGLDTQLGTAFDDGVELSGGQWQKLALGRSMMRERPLLLLLDEPTAALDARAEHELFERYAGAADGAAATVGAITLLVSHRFSTVREADLILVVDGKRIAAAGTHAELMQQGGLYAELYELQARAYR